MGIGDWFKKTFGKQTCAFCGKEVGMMGRDKIKNDEFICSDCKRTCSRYIQVYRMTKDELLGHMEYMKRQGKLVESIDKWDEELLLDKQKEDPDAENDQTEATEPAEPTLQELIIGTWEDQETEYKETFTFNADGTGKYSFEDNGHWEYTFTYEWYDGDYVEFTYDDDGSVSGFTVRIEGDVMYISNTAVADMPLVRK